MGVISATFLTCTVLAFAVALLAHKLDRRAAELYYAAAVITMFAGFSRTVAAFVDPPMSMSFYPIQDAMCVAMCWAAWRAKPEPWKAALAVMFLIQCGLHAMFWTLDGAVSLRSYILWNNIFYGGELAAITLAGGGYVVRRLADRLGLLVGGLPHYHPRAGGRG